MSSRPAARQVNPPGLTATPPCRRGESPGLRRPPLPRGVGGIEQYPTLLPDSVDLCALHGSDPLAKPWAEAPSVGSGQALEAEGSGQVRSYSRRGSKARPFQSVTLGYTLLELFVGLWPPGNNRCSMHSAADLETRLFASGPARGHCPATAYWPAPGRIAVSVARAAGFPQ
jgi:hypothetical protein